MKQAFLSYARTDSQKATRLYRQLSRCLSPEFRVWFDREDLPPGAEVTPGILKAIRESDYFVAVLSSDAVSKPGYRHSELSEALEMTKNFPQGWIFIMPTRLDDCGMPFEQLKGKYYTDLFPKKSDWNKGVARLCQTIKAGRRAPGPAGKPVKTTAAKPRPQAHRTPGASRTPQVRISYKVGLLDLGKRIPTIGKIAAGLNRVQSTFHFTSERFATPRKALVTMGGSPQLYISQLPDSFYKRIGLIQTDYVVSLSRQLLAFDEKDYVYYHYLAYESPAEKRVSFISYADLDEYSREAGVTLNSALAFVITAELVDHFLRLGYHKQTRNCPMDYSMDHSDLVDGLRLGHFCRYCSRTLNNSKPFGEAFKAMIDWGR